jgi:phosphoesterase RecJ-like protein
MDDLNKAKNLIGAADKILITSHVFPDDDAIASSLAMFGYLESIGKHPRLRFTNNETSHWSFLPRADMIEWCEDIASEINSFDLVIFLDGNTLSRFSNRASEIGLTKFKSICVDHHKGEPDNFTLNLSDLGAASTSQLIYKYFVKQDSELTKLLAETILLGIMGDTGTFRYINFSNVEAMKIAIDLIETGRLDVQSLDLHMSQIRPQVTKVLAVLLENTETVDLEGGQGYSYSYLPMEALQKYDLTEVKEAVAKYKFGFLRQLQGYNWGFVISPDSEEQFGISFRSTPGSPMVRDFAIQFGGGGHDLAAAGQYNFNEQGELSARELADKVIEIIQNSKLEIKQL